MKPLLACALLGIASCVAIPDERLETTWKGEAHPGVMSSLAFDVDGTARWSVELPSGTEVHELRYDLDCGSDPAHLDFTGFETGPLAGKTLYGIAEWDDHRMRIDVELGEPGQGGDVVRPKAFSSDARVFTRVP